LRFDRAYHLAYLTEPERYSVHQGVGIQASRLLANASTVF
jgi:hypothetical protein